MFTLVEMRGVEPLSENIAIQLSPSADVILNFAFSPPNDGLLDRYLDKFPCKPPRIGLKVSRILTAHPCLQEKRRGQLAN